MPSENYILLERIELNTATASVTFANIPQSGYTDLKIVCSTRSDYAGFLDLNMYLNGNASSGYSWRRLNGDGGSATSTNSTSAGVIPSPTLGTTATANTFTNTEIYIPNYTSTTSKSISIDGVTENNATTSYQAFTAGLSTLSTAITSVSFGLGAGNFVSGSTFSLYGIAALGTTPVIAPKASGGNVIATDGTYWYHAFRTSGTFIPQQGLTTDILVVAGGGSGGTSVGGGGGAGGLLGFTSQALTSGTSYTCTIGAGGAAVGSNSVGNDGSPSQFGALTQAAGGGGGGSYSAGKNGRSGGSGGGAGGWDNPATGGAASPSGQGNAGGSVSAGTYGAGGSGGGGGAGTAGQSYTGGSTGSSGGRGSSAYSSWAAATGTGVLYSGSYYFAAGGPGVYGSGGTQASASYGTVAFGGLSVANSGQGGCGDYGYAGGSGIVIIRYPVAS